MTSSSTNPTVAHGTTQYSDNLKFVNSMTVGFPHDMVTLAVDATRSSGGEMSRTEVLDILIDMNKVAPVTIEAWDRDDGIDFGGYKDNDYNIMWDGYTRKGDFVSAYELFGGDVHTNIFDLLAGGKCETPTPDWFITNMMKYNIYV